MKDKQRLVFMFAGAVDGFLGALALLAYFGVLPLDAASWDIPRWVIGMIGAILFFPGMAIFIYHLTRNDS
jgi:integral membrane sensor domain MASE1